MIQTFTQNVAEVNLNSAKTKQLLYRAEILSDSTGFKEKIEFTLEKSGDSRIATSL